MNAVCMSIVVVATTKMREPERTDGKNAHFRINYNNNGNVKGEQQHSVRPVKLMAVIVNLKFGLCFFKERKNSNKKMQQKVRPEKPSSLKVSTRKRDTGASGRS